MIEFIEANRKEFGVESICSVLPIAPSTYYATKTRPPSKRQVDDERLVVEIRRVWEENYRVYGRRKIWAQLNREDIPIGRDRCERLMKQAGITGAVRGRRPQTTTPDASAPRAPDLIDRDWNVAGPNRVWVSDFTYVRTWAAMAYVAFVIDIYSRRIVGWRVATSMRTDLVLDALEHAIWSRDQRLDGLIAHSDAGKPIHQHPLHRTAWPTSVPLPRSDPSAIRSTTPWPSPPSVSTRPNSSPAEDRGGPSTTSSSQRSNTSTGSTTDACMARQATSHQSRPSNCSTINNPPPPRGPTQRSEVSTKPRPVHIEETRRALRLERRRKERGVGWGDAVFTWPSWTTRETLTASLQLRGGPPRGW